VVAGGADTQLGLLGAGVRAGEFTLPAGTFWQNTVLMVKPLIDPAVRPRTLCHVTPGEWMVEGIRFFCGLAMRWYRDAFCDSEATVVRSRGVDPYVVTEEGAALIPPGSNGVYAVLSNLMNARRWTHASPSFLQFDLGNPAGSGRSTCIGAVEEAAAYVVRGHFDIICGLTAWRRDRGKERKADSDTVIDAERFSLDVPARSKPYDLKGSGALDWAMQSRLARIFRPPANRTVMVAIDHGYFQGPTNGLERVDLSIVPLLKYADALTATRGIVRTTIPAASRTPVVLRASGGPGILRELSDEQIAVSLEDTARINASAAVQVFIDGEFESRSVHNMTPLVDQSQRYGIPVQYLRERQ
jgi:hypothetical protein